MTGKPKRFITMNRFVLYAITLILLFSGATSYCQYPYPSMAHNGVESELLSRAGNKLVIYDAYSKELYSSDSTNLTLIHDFMFSNNQPSLRDYETTTDYLYFSGIVSPPGSYEYYNVYKTDGITLDTVFNFKSSFNTSIYPPWKNLATYNDTLYFWQSSRLLVLKAALDKVFDNLSGQSN